MVKVRGQNKVRPCTSIDSTGSTPYRNGDGEIMEEVIIPPNFENDDEYPISIGDLVNSYQKFYPHMCKKCYMRFKVKEDLKIHEKCSHLKKQQTYQRRLCQQSSHPNLPPPETRSVLPQAQTRGIGPSSNWGMGPFSYSGNETLDLSLTLGNSWTRPGPQDEGVGTSNCGVTRLWLWVQEVKMALDRVDGDYTRLMNITGGLENVVSYFQTLSDEELELKLSV